MLEDSAVTTVNLLIVQCDIQVFLNCVKYLQKDLKERECLCYFNGTPRVGMYVRGKQMRPQAEDATPAVVDGSLARRDEANNF